MKYAQLVAEPYCARLALKTPPATEPVSVAELMTHSRIDNGDEGPYLAALITASRQWIEQYLGRQLITATWTMRLDAFPMDDEFELPRAPLLAAPAPIVQYYDSNRVQQTVAAATYNVHTFAGPEAGTGFIELASGNAWPSVYLGEGAVQIEFAAGYGAAAADVPAQIRQAILMHAAEMYERREQVVVGTISSPVAITVERLLWPLRVF